MNYECLDVPRRGDLSRGGKKCKLSGLIRYSSLCERRKARGRSANAFSLRDAVKGSEKLRARKRRKKETSILSSFAFVFYAFSVVWNSASASPEKTLRCDGKQKQKEKLSPSAEDFSLSSGRDGFFSSFPVHIKTKTSKLQEDWNKARENVIVELACCGMQFTCLRLRLQEN